MAADGRQRNDSHTLYLYLAVLAVVWWGVARLIGLFLPGLPGNALFYGLVALITLVFCRLRGVTAKALGFSRERVGRQLLTGVLVGCAVLLLCIGGFSLAGLRPREYLSAAAPDVRALLCNLAFYALLVGPVEELVFRGCLLDLPGGSVLLSSLLFGLAHLRGGSLLQVCMTFGIGLCYALAKRRLPHCTLLSVMVAHSLHNIALELMRYMWC